MMDISRRQFLEAVGGRAKHSAILGLGLGVTFNSYKASKVEYKAAGLTDEQVDRLAAKRSLLQILGFTAWGAGIGVGSKLMLEPALRILFAKWHTPMTPEKRENDPLYQEIEQSIKNIIGEDTDPKASGPELGKN